METSSMMRHLVLSHRVFAFGFLLIFFTSSVALSLPKPMPSKCQSLRESNNKAVSPLRT